MMRNNNSSSESDEYSKSVGKDLKEVLIIVSISIFPVLYWDYYLHLSLDLKLEKI